MRKVLTLFVFTIITQTVFGLQKPITISDYGQKLITQNYFTIYEDVSGEVTIRELLRYTNLQSSKRYLPAFGVKGSVIWLKFNIRNVSDKKDLILTISNTVVDAIDMYEVTGQYHYTLSHYASGRRQGIPMRGLFSQQKPLIRFTISPGKEKTYFLRVEGSEPNVLPIYVSTRETYLQNRITEDISFGGFLGILIITVFFNLFIFFILRDKSYIYYVSYTLFLCLSQFILRGYGTAIFFAGFYEINNLILPIIRSITGISIILYVFEFLQLENQIKKANRYFYIGFILYLIPIILSLAGKPKPAYLFLNADALILTLSLMYVATILYRRGFKPSRFFMIGWGLFLVSILITLAKNNGFLPYSPFLDNLMLYSIAIQAILFSVALADKISFYKDQKNESQEMALQIARENEQLIISQNHMLETQVKQRTQKLQESNKNLETLLHNLRAAQTALVEQEKMASLGQLTAGIAHEINNPINYVGSNVKPLRLGIDELMILLNKYEEWEHDPKNIHLLAEIKGLRSTLDIEYLQHEIVTLLDGIEDGAQRTSEIVKSLRTFSRTDEQELKPADINKGILTTLVLLRQTIPPYIHVHTEFDELPPVNCYPGKLNQVYMNLLNNSIQGIIAKKQHGEENITIQTTNLDDAVTVSIRDTGIGMNEHTQKRIFEPFFTTKEVGEGTGLGMSIVFGIIEKHKGNIEVKSAPDEGTIITIKLPKDLTVE